MGLTVSMLLYVFRKRGRRCISRLSKERLYSTFSSTPLWRECYREPGNAVWKFLPWQCYWQREKWVSTALWKDWIQVQSYVDLVSSFQISCELAVLAWGSQTCQGYCYVPAEWWYPSLCGLPYLCGKSRGICLNLTCNSRGFMMDDLP